MRVEADLPIEAAERLRRCVEVWGMDPASIVAAMICISVGGLPVVEHEDPSADEDPDATPEQIWREWEQFRDNVNENRFPGPTVYPLDDLSSYTPPPGVEGRRRAPGTLVATAEANPVRRPAAVP